MGMCAGHVSMKCNKWERYHAGKEGKPAAKALFDVHNNKRDHENQLITTYHWALVNLDSRTPGHLIRTSGFFYVAPGGTNPPENSCRN